MALKFIRYNFNIYKAEFRMYGYIGYTKSNRDWKIDTSNGMQNYVMERLNNSIN